MAAIDFGSLIDKLDDESDRAALADREQQRTLFLKYVVRTGNFPDKRAQLLKEYEAGASLTGPKGVRRMLGGLRRADRQRLEILCCAACQRDQDRGHRLRKKDPRPAA